MSTVEVERSSAFRIGYILHPWADFVWFLSMPFWAFGVALAAQSWLPGAALVSFSLLITVPHHFATWLRSYGFADERTRWMSQLFIGPIIIFVASFFGLLWSPMTVALIVFLWDHQHSLMQQHGFARIYDFKAGAGAPSTPRFDLILSWFLYVNLVLTMPLWVEGWIVEMTRWRIPHSVAGIRAVQTISITATGVFIVIYIGHVIWSVTRGYKINPLKYFFLIASYFLWYYTSWISQSILFYSIAHRLMHGVQYEVIVHSYIRRKVDREKLTSGFMSRFARPGNIALFILLGLVYAVFYNFITGQGVEEFGFGFVDFANKFDSLGELGFSSLSMRERFEIFSLTILTAVPLCHYFVDSFVWKVRDKNVQKGL